VRIRARRQVLVYRKRNVDVGAKNKTAGSTHCRPLRRDSGMCSTGVRRRENLHPRGNRLLSLLA
jgi:hypothetical protein